LNLTIGREQKAFLPARLTGDASSSSPLRTSIGACSGFVTECYKSAGIVLIEPDSATLPEVDLATLRQGYGSSIDDPNRRAMIGLDGEGPWRMLLAGYVIHAAARDSRKVRDKPYCPSDTDAAEFP
jgi:hypothetical protein